MYSAAIVPSEDDMGTNIITGDFNIGAPEGVTWQSSYGGLTFDGNNAVFSEDAFEGEIILTATMIPVAGPSGLKRLPADGISRQIVINVNKAVLSAINDVTSNKTVKAMRYYNLQGIEVANPADFKGILIKVNQYTDGTQSSTRLVK